MKKSIKIVLVLGILMGVLFMQTQVQAGEPLVITGNTINGGNNTTNTLNTAGGATNTAGTNNTVTPTPSTTNNTANTNKANNVTNTLPKTGIEDSPAAIIMIIGVISAIYAYKKIRDYNV